ncbi:FAD assembly factor SdhE [Rodentibacter haemolyticus]|uniref:FAD assembly factor SdhE n=1 Tax=Rodentibacter haemolyticus TaxID=2778911 RepID=A0ABX6UV56_9PAST|nr:succinate dehydrogenase assembly factor 2 [Rodentibacter haemolyticus]QPB41569.1 succinate dehydrogenase assembly factor 2 [Rodentibacter haemolyticus]
MEKYNKLRIEWDCRRGMLELDKIIMPFYKQHFDELPNTQKDIFIRLLASTDLQLFSWFFNRGKAEDAELQSMVEYIQTKQKISTI